MARKRADPEEPVSVWSEKDLLNSEIVDALVIILRSRGCYWSRQSGCLMCGYNNDCLGTVTAENLVKQFEKAMEKYSGQEYIKIYTSGSFLDPREIEPEARDRILEMAGGKARKVLCESRPEFVSRSNMEPALAHVKELEIAVGLETANDDIRARCINKGFQYADFESACNTAREMNASIRTYLLLKPPYLTEGSAITDVIESVKIAGPLCQTISVNPMNVQRRTAVESLWKRGLYRPPWLWSLVKVLEEGSRLTDTRLISAPSGGGSRRGVHNCGECDEAILKAVETFSLGGAGPDAFKGLNCVCREHWQDYLDIEPLMGTTGDLERLSPP
ncbi:MAG: archaeosine biosynthesis radical SAM protein RaSEA [Candidatus Thermoplasmatota archaeon]|nr:TIGR01210 family radical SAM protein [Euryarchaeota archaeon]MBU4031670.1 archaeosine biosynthesis radical SAM protein RaSEA [Candidatus Thermoplasmatota archaeon]MBU4071279.1 archaeosine biosynthesis radical SAM protein RaSEA [Candidatus Thermoplasmatota archaeon]MBU4144331.1 archaeosine biosynthesis radical SAM protein RaSEA [Candidatus Thermoplasmatota archaeon]MBU4591927.1 archaeosine biosynthesis radical SAM protein RaSEA [Candidatus Thermoplasmatota archaeon]